MKKKIIIIALAVIIIGLVSLNFIPFRYNGFVFNITFKGVHITDYVGNEKSITIPEKMWYIPVTSIDGFWEIDDVENIVIEAQVEKITGRTLFDCFRLKSVTLPKSLKEIKVIDDELSDSPSLMVFSGCRSLEKIEVEKGNEYFESIDGVLYNKKRKSIVRCPENKAGNITIPDWVLAVEGIEDDNSPFDNCEKIHTVSIPKKLKKFKRNIRGYSSGLYDFTVVIRNKKML